MWLGHRCKVCNAQNVGDTPRRAEGAMRSAQHVQRHSADQVRNVRGAECGGAPRGAQSVQCAVRSMQSHIPHQLCSGTQSL